MLLIKLTNSVKESSPNSGHVGRGLSTQSKARLGNLVPSCQLGTLQLFCYLVSCPDDRKVYWSRESGWVFPTHVSSLVWWILLRNPEDIFGVAYTGAGGQHHYKMSTLCLLSLFFFNVTKVKIHFTFNFVALPTVKIKQLYALWDV